MEEVIYSIGGLTIILEAETAENIDVTIDNDESMTISSELELVVKSLTFDSESDVTLTDLTIKSDTNLVLTSDVRLPSSVNLTLNSGSIDISDTTTLLEKNTGADTTISTDGTIDISGIDLTTGTGGTVGVSSTGTITSDDISVGGGITISAGDGIASSGTIGITPAILDEIQSPPPITIIQPAPTLDGTESDDKLKGTKQDDFIIGNAGDDKLIGRKGNDVLIGGDGNDILRGGKGDDLLLSGEGDDLLRGGKGNDTYVVNINGEGNDVINDRKGDDTLQIGGANHDDLWFWKEGKDLLIGLRDTENQLTIKSWFSNSNKRIETIVSGNDGHVLVESQVQQLVDAMSMFDVQQQGHLNISQQDVDSVQTVITEVWS